MAKKTEPKVEAAAPAPMSYAERWRAAHNFLEAFGDLSEVRAALEAAKDAEAAVEAARADLAGLEAGIEAATQDLRAVEMSITEAQEDRDAIRVATAAEREARLAELGRELETQREAALHLQQTAAEGLARDIGRRTQTLTDLEAAITARQAELGRVEATVAELNREHERLLAKFGVGR